MAAAPDIVDTTPLLRSNIIFEGLTDSELDTITLSAREQTFNASDYIIREGEIGQDLYIIKSGQVNIVKKTMAGDMEMEFTLTELTAGETIGEVALLDNVVRTASAVAAMETVVLVLPIAVLKTLSINEKNYQIIQEQLKQLEKNLLQPPAYAKMALNLAKSLSRKLSNTNVVTADALREELRLSELRIATGRFLIILISIMVLYSYCLTALPLVERHISSTSFVTIPLLCIYTGAILYVMFSSNYSLSFYGLTLKNWKWSFIEGVLWSIPAMIFTVVMKWLIIHVFNLNVPLIQGYEEAFKNLSPMAVVILIVAYLLLTPLQELIVRGGVQSSLQQFLSGKHRVVLAIIISNLIFSMTHLHMSIAMGLFVLLFGIYWGFLYARQGNIIGVSVSHLIVGGFGFFVVGVDQILGVHLG